MARNEKFETDLNIVIENTFKSLRGEETDTESRLVFPEYRNQERRVSEQELRFVFVEQIQSLLKQYGYYYSVETPTRDKYKFSENRKNIVCQSGVGQSASFDLTIKDRNKNVAIIEFKAKSAGPHEYAKDLCKLWNNKEDGEFRYFINIFEKMANKTRNKLIEKLTPSQNGFLEEKTSNVKVHVIAQSTNLEDKEFYVNDFY